MKCKIKNNICERTSLEIHDISKKELKLLKSKEVDGFIEIEIQIPYHTKPEPSLCDDCINAYYPDNTAYRVYISGVKSKNYKKRLCSGEHPSLEITTRGEPQCIHYREEI